MDRRKRAWDGRSVHATMPRPAPVSHVTALQSLLGLVVALAVGGLLLFVVLAVSGAGAAWWAVLAGALACASGVVLGSTRYTPVAVGLGVAAAASLAIAIGSSGEPEPRAAFPARENLRPTTGERSRGIDEAGRAETAPRRRRAAASDTPAVVAPAAAEDLVRSYYAALDAGDFEKAWGQLAPQVRTAFGGLEAWRDGYGSTLGHRIEDLTVDAGGVVRHVLVAFDRTPCGGRTERRFAVTWRLVPAGEGWQAAELSASKLAGEEPAAAC
jgi:hypothetical protein